MPLRYVGKRAGYHRVVGQVSFAANATGLRSPEIQVNGSRLTPWPHPIGSASSSLQTTMQVSATVHLNGTTDYVELFAFQNSGSSLALLTLQSWLSVEWIRP